MIKKILYILNSKEKKQLWVVGFVVILMAFVDAIGVASIMPFIAVLTDADLIRENQILYSVFGFFKELFNIDEADFKLILGLATFCFLLISIVFKIITNYILIHFALMREYTIGERIVTTYLKQPYSWFLINKGSNISKTILSEVSAIIAGAILPLLTIFSQGALALAMLALIFFVDPEAAITVGAVLISLYYLIYNVMNNRLSKLGEKRLSSNQERFSIINEAFGGIKELKIKNMEDRYINKFSRQAKIYAKTQVESQLIGQLPRYIFEAIAFGGVLLLILIKMMSGDSLSQILSITSLYLFAGYRLMPALQQLYVAFTQLKFAEPAVNDIYNSLSKLKLEHNYTDDNIITAFENRLSIEGITYKYLSAEKEILKNLSIEIYSNSTVGFVGETGSGKTTLVDVILGLLEPKAGSVKVDGVELTKKNIQQWRKKIGYVQQNVYLTDEDIVSNIAYGIDKDKVDLEEVVRVAKIAEIHDFIINELSNGYQTNIGERGVRLSGGQKQRIGIARALYGRPAILILDEATSALDNITEKKVMNNIRAVSEKLSLIIIAHRLSTIEFCDTIYLFKQGRIIANGTYRYLSEKNSEFIHLVRGGV